MNSVRRSLWWKEWREHRWKLAALTAIFVAVPLLSTLRRPENVYGAVSQTLLMLMPLASMFLAMHIAAGEQSRRTLPFLQSLPIDMRRPAVFKLMAAIATAVVPVLAAVGVALLASWMINPGDTAEAIAIDLRTYHTSWLIDDWFAARAVGGALAAISIVLWMAAPGVNRTDEVSAAAMGLLVSLGVWALIAGFHLDKNASRYWTYAMAAAAGGPALSEPGEAAGELVKHGAGRIETLYPFAIAALASHVLLAGWFIGRFGRVNRTRAQVEEQPRPVIEKSWLPPPRNRPMTALIWKQTHESLPLAALAAGLVIVVALVISGYMAWLGEGEQVAPTLIAGLAAGWAVTGFFVAIVAGIGVFMDEMQPRLHTFWRSRPMAINQWFWIKFATGLIITVVTLASPLCVAVLVALVTRMELPPASAMGELLATGRNMLIGHVALYCAAVLAIVLVRQAIYAAILAVAAIGLMIPVVDFLGLSFSTFLVLLVAAAVSAAVAALISVRKDWGWAP